MFIVARPYSLCLFAFVVFATISGCAAFRATTETRGDTDQSQPTQVRVLPPEYLGTIQQRAASAPLQSTTISIVGLSADILSSARAVPLSAVSGTSTFTPLASTTTRSTRPEDVIDPYSLSNEQVLQLQQGLIDQGFNPDRLSGVFGRQTDDALGAFMAFNYPGLPLQQRMLEYLGVSF